MEPELLGFIWTIGVQSETASRQTTTPTIHAELSNRDSNKGIADRVYKPYSALLIRMRELNLKMEGLVDVFDAASRHVAAEAHRARVNVVRR